MKHMNMVIAVLVLCVIGVGYYMYKHRNVQDVAIQCQFGKNRFGFCNPSPTW